MIWSEDRAAIARIPYDEVSYLAETGAPAVFGEPGYTTRERLWARPTLDVNGLTSGWQGIGSKTVLPAEARAKITCRLVADQDPTRVLATLAAHVQAHCPAGVTAHLEPEQGGAGPFLVPSAQRDRDGAVLEEVHGKAPTARAGRSIP